VHFWSLLCKYIRMHVAENVRFILPFYFHPEVCFIAPKRLPRTASLIQFSTNENSLLPMQVLAVYYDLSASQEQFLPLTATALPRTIGRLGQCFSTAGPRPGTRTWHQLYRAARGSPGICHFSFLSNFHE